MIYTNTHPISYLHPSESTTLTNKTPPNPPSIAIPTQTQASVLQPGVSSTTKSHPRPKTPRGKPSQAEPSRHGRQPRLKLQGSPYQANKPPSPMQRCTKQYHQKSHKHPVSLPNNNSHIIPSNTPSTPPPSSYHLRQSERERGAFIPAYQYHHPRPSTITPCRGCRSRYQISLAAHRFVQKKEKTTTTSKQPSQTKPPKSPGKKLAMIITITMQMPLSFFPNSIQWMPKKKQKNRNAVPTVQQHNAY